MNWKYAAKGLAIVILLLGLNMWTGLIGKQYQRESPFLEGVETSEVDVADSAEYHSSRADDWYEQVYSTHSDECVLLGESIVQWVGKSHKWDNVYKVSGAGRSQGTPCRDGDLVVIGDIDEWLNL